MKLSASNRVVFNTFVLYSKIVISMCIGLISMPMNLHALGASDYGIFSLVAGIIAMLAFLNNSMTVSTQRYISVSIGRNESSTVNLIYNSSIILHFIIAAIVIILFQLFGFLFFDKLNIPLDSIGRAKYVFEFLIVSTFLSIITVPFDAIMNAKEDMVAFSVIGLLDSLLILLLAFVITNYGGDRLILYGLGMAIISIITSFIKILFVKIKYKELSFNFKNRNNVACIKEMFGFTAWNTFGALANLGRNQGVAVIINLFSGTIANAAYGIANQINGVVSQFSVTFQKAINPQLMKSEGAGNRNRMLRIACQSSKFSVLSLSLFAIPLILVMPDVLSIWLKNDIPNNTIILSQLILVMMIIYQYSAGLMSAIQSAGRIKKYQLTMSAIIIANVPASFLLLKLGFPIYSVILSFITLEFISLVIRMSFAKKLVDLEVVFFLKETVYPTLIIIIISLIFAIIPRFVLKEGFVRILVVSFLYVLSFAILTWKLALDKRMQNDIKSWIKSKLHICN